MFILQNPRSCHVKEWYLGMLGSQQLSVWSLSFCPTPLYGKPTEQGPATELPSSLALLGSDIRLTKEGNFPGWCADWSAKPGNSQGPVLLWPLKAGCWAVTWVSSHLWCLTDVTWLLCVVLGPCGFKGKVGVCVETLDYGLNNLNTSVRYSNLRSDLILMVSRKC